MRDGRDRVERGIGALACGLVLVPPLEERGNARLVQRRCGLLRSALSSGGAVSVSDSAADTGSSFVRLESGNRADPPRLEVTRINVIGTSGSGKTTFARTLAAALDLPCVELDAIFWGPAWRQRSDAEFFPRVEEIVAQERWVLDGNYSRTTAIKWARAERVIWLDHSFVRTVLRVTRRCLRRSFTREEIWPGTGNRETLRQSFLSRRSVILWAITNHRRNRRRYRALFADPPPEGAHIEFVRLRSPREVARYLAKARREAE